MLPEESPDHEQGSSLRGSSSSQDLSNPRTSEQRAARADDLPRSEQRAALRKEVLAVRGELPRPYRLHKSSAICDELEEGLELTCAMLGIEPADCTVAVYSAFDEEVQLDQFIRAAYARGAKVAFPCIVADAWSTDDTLPQTMEMRLVSREAYEADDAPFIANPLKRYAHDDAELEAFPYVPADRITMIVIPLVAFDAHHNRLGYGGGNYDRYLPQLDGSCRQIGVAFTEQEVPFIPAEPYDVPVTVLAR